MTKSMGYLLPAGDAYTDEMSCLLLFYPDKAEYRHALFGALDYFGTWLAWERDVDKRGKDAARAWSEAIAVTRDCIAMNVCETILDLLTDIEINTRTCCGETNYVSYQANTIITTTIVPGEGTDPTHYGETAVADWDEWSEYVCYQAHAYVDDLIDTAEKLHLALSVGGYVLDFIAHLFSVVQWRMVEELIPVNFSVIQAVFNGLGQGGIQNEFDDLATDFETYREDIVCALILGTSLEEAVKDVVGAANPLWTIYYQWLDYDTTTAVIYEGQVEDFGYLTPIKRTDCTSCEEPPAVPTGYHLEFPVYDTFANYLNVASNTVDYDETTGLLTISVTAGGGGNLEFKHLFDDIDGNAPFFHGYIWEQVAFTSVCQFYAVYNGKFDSLPDGSRVGKRFAGYNTNQHGGATWDDWVATFDYTGNHSENGMDGLRQRNNVNNCAGSGKTHTWQIRLWAVIQD